MDTQHEAGQSASVVEGRAQRRQRWEGIVAAYVRSGMPVAAYCQEHGLKAWQLHSWRRRLSTGATGVAGGFEQVSPPLRKLKESDRTSRGELILEVNGCLIHVPEWVSAARLGEILSVVRSA